MNAITLPRDTVEQALNALESQQPGTITGTATAWGDFIGKRKVAITALRAALQQAEPQRTKEKTSEMENVFEIARKAVAHQFSHYHDVMREPKAQAGYLHLKPPFEDENGNDISGEYITLQAHREALQDQTIGYEKTIDKLQDAIAKKDAALKACVMQMKFWRLAIAHESATQQGYDDFDAAITQAEGAMK